MGYNFRGGNREQAGEEGEDAMRTEARIKEVLGKGAEPIVRQSEESKTERNMIPLSAGRKMGTKKSRILAERHMRMGA